MFLNLLATTVDKYREASIGEAALYALLGFLVVFVGIAFLILVVWLTGKFMTKTQTPQKKEVKIESPLENVSESLAVADGDAVNEETIAVITAAIMAYYQQTNPKCEFTVKRIKRI